MRVFINYVSHPSSVEEFANKFKDCQELDMECLLNEDVVHWTVARHAEPKDIVLFIHTRSAGRHIANIEKEMQESKDYAFLENFLQRSKDIYEKYGGKICAIGEILDIPFHFDDFGYENHFKSRHFAAIGNICILENPIDTMEIANILDITKHYSSVPLKTETFDKIREVIQQTNKTPEYFDIAKANEEVDQNKDMRFAACYHVPLAGEIHEGFEEHEHCLMANVSEHHLKDMLFKFVDEICEPCFFILETPLKRDKEEELQKTDPNRFHAQVYYIDGMKKDEITQMLNERYDDFRKDGLISFGVASHETGDEMFITKYNIVRLFSEDKTKYEKFLDEFGIKKFDKIKTAWDTFRKDAPGKAFACDKDEIKDFIKMAKEKYGLYPAEIR